MDEDLKKLMYLPCCNEKISIYERTRPVEKKIQKVEIIVPNTEIVHGEKNIGLKIILISMTPHLYMDMVYVNRELVIL